MDPVTVNSNSMLDGRFVLSDTKLTFAVTDASLGVLYLVAFATTVAVTAIRPVDPCKISVSPILYVPIARMVASPYRFSAGLVEYAVDPNEKSPNIYYACDSDHDTLPTIVNGLFVVTNDGSSESLATMVKTSGPSGNVLSPPRIELPSVATSPNCSVVTTGVLPEVPVPPSALNE